MMSFIIGLIVGVFIGLILILIFGMDALAKEFDEWEGE